MFGIQPIHILVIIVVGLIIFGPQRLPEMGRNIGKAITEFRRGAKEITDVFSEDDRKTADLLRGINAPMIDPVAAPPAAAAGSIPAAPIRAPAAAPGIVGNFCPRCGANNLLQAKFCSQCGERFPEKTA